jgi:hypothetical protein
MYRVSCTSLLLAAILLTLCGSTGDAQTIITRKRLGNNTEGITRFPQDRREGVAILDGWDVFVVSLSGSIPAPAAPPIPCDPSRVGARRTCRKLFGVHGMGIEPRGVVYVPSQDRFYFGDFDSTRLDVTDAGGTLLPPLNLQYSTAPLDFVQFEGLTYIPPESTIYPDTIAAITIHGTSFVAHIQIIRPADGVVVDEIVPTEGQLTTYLTGIAYKAPGRLLLSPLGGTGIVYEVDAGSVVQTAILAEAQGFEGLTTLDDGRVVAADYSSGQLFVLDSSLARQASDDREFKIGFGISRPHIAWNSNTDEFVFTGNAGGGGLFVVSSDLNRSTQIASFPGQPYAFAAIGGVGYLPTEAGYPQAGDLIAVTNPTGATRGVLLFDSVGNYLSRIALTDPTFPFSGNWRPTGVTALPGNRLAFRVQGAFRDIRVISRPTDPTAASVFTPTWLETFQLSTSPGGLGLTFFSTPTSDEFLAGPSVYAANGLFLNAIDTTSFDVAPFPEVIPITTGKLAGNYALVDSDHSELVIFSVP